MATLQLAYDHPTHTVMRQETRHCQIAATGVQRQATFRSKLKAIVTGIWLQVVSAATGSLIMTLTHNGSVMAIKTLGNTANENGPQGFTLTSNKTLDSITDRLEIGTPTHATGEFCVVYEYKIVPQDIQTFGNNFI